MDIRRISVSDSTVIGENLKKIMERTGMETEDLAKQMGTAPEALAGLLSGEEIFTLWQVMMAARVLDVSLDELVNGCELQGGSSRAAARFYGVLPELSDENVDKVMNYATFLASGRWNGFRNEVLKESGTEYGTNAYYKNVRRINNGGFQGKKSEQHIGNGDDRR